MRRFALMIALLLPLAAWAQPVSDRYTPVLILANDLARVQQEVGSLYQEITRLTAEREQLDKYLKACGDRPGCTQPVTPEVAVK